MVNDLRVWSINTSMASAKQNGDGTMTGISGPVTLGGTANGWTWTSGPASCQATLYYFSRDKQTGGLIYNYLASTTFDVGA